MQLAVALKNLSIRLFSPLFFDVDFAKAYWPRELIVGRTWLLGALVCDLLAQYLMGQPTWWSLAASLLQPVLFWWLPPVLCAAVAGLFVMRALGSMAVVWGSVGLAVYFQFPPILLAPYAAGAWQIWCIAALLYLLLKYVRTPKREIYGNPELVG